jgi:protein TonB
VQAARLLNRVMPVYPPLARANRITGVVMLTAIISADGLIRELRVASGHPLLVPAAVQAVRQWTYRPTLLNGVPVEVITTIEVNFKLGQ